MEIGRRCVGDFSAILHIVDKCAGDMDRTGGGTKLLAVEGCLDC